MAVGGLVRGSVRYACMLALAIIQLLLVWWFAVAAYKIRMYPIQDFGYTIHEFDPWFNYRATEYLAAHGTEKFFKWYDYMSWYPLGRPVGTTIYPGMQMTAVAIWEAMKHVPEFHYEPPAWLRKQEGSSAVIEYLKTKNWWLPSVFAEFDFKPMTINEICCMIPPWFGALTSLVLGLLTYEISRSTNAAVVSVGVMAIIPAHLMRSVGGKFDNEAVAMVAICGTFWLWLRSVRTPKSWPFGVLAGLSYVYMVAAWGGYIFVLNMIGVHALLLVALGRFNSGVHKAYSLFFVIGTLGAIQVPVVGFQPLRSLEQIGPLGVFLGYQALAYCDSQRRRQKMKASEFTWFRIKVLLALLAAVVAVAVLLWPTGYFGPLSSRIRGLFVKHTKTGNPLVDSVAEHQPASQGIYQSYLHLPLDYAPLGLMVLLWKRNNAVYFALLYAFVATHFSGKMSRLVLICGPITSILCGVWIGALLDFCFAPVLLALGKPGYRSHLDLTSTAGVANGTHANGSGAANGAAKAKQPSSGKKEKGGKAPAAAAAASNKRSGSSKAELSWPLEEWEEDCRPGGMAQLKRAFKRQFFENIAPDAEQRMEELRVEYDSSPNCVLVRASVGFALFLYMLAATPDQVGAFASHADQVARSMSTAQVKFKSQLRDGSPIVVDDYWAGYKWIEANTPEDSRVMAWWDYGYQITGIANRTSIADGNTWNHEHIATLGRMLTSPQKRAHNAIRHLADYVLVWAGGHKDDLGKSPHLARIGNSVFPDHCGDDDPKCYKFGFYNQDRNQPTPMMKKSLLFNLVNHGIQKGAKADESLWEEVHSTRHGLMRIYKVLNVSEESKAWIADPANRICDAPGSWYCVGQYPPGISKLIEKRRSFSQVEDFNKKGEKSAYTKLIEKEKGEL